MSYAKKPKPYLVLTPTGDQISSHFTRLGAEAMARRKRIVRYVSFCQERGSEYWWDTWCEHVAGNKANRDLDTGDLVSRYHVQAVKM